MISPAFKEPPPAGWTSAQPNDAVPRGKWWEIYQDPQLNQLEEQVSAGAWQVRNVDADTVLSEQPAALWQKLAGPATLTASSR